ncbi:uncharacterized protein LOC128504589 [Spea bombifrons]|uniref:uncharacterized protein LOC128504589 n=1 Tax=Spea bombifrons TaxID=233779 RepID=UPI0023495DEC|nr:uncharacterized protein LOC128504589 [Spea bombifrons]
MSSTHSASLELSQVGKPLRRSTAGSHLPSGLGGQGKPLLKGDVQHEFSLHASNRRSSGNEQKLVRLQEENALLKQELEDLRNQHRQLIDEGKNECLDERRVTLLKSQVLQLQRQVMLLTEGLSSRASLMLELDNSLQPVLDKLRSLLATEGHTPEVPVARADLIQMIGTCQAMRDKIHRNHQATSVDKLAVPWILSERQATKNPVTLMDLCYGKMDNLNLLYVSSLEGKLSTLFRDLHATKQTLSLILAPGPESPERAHHILPTAIYSRLINHLTRCNQSLEECCRDLLTMTLIVPSAPWAKIECPVSQEFTVENVLAALPAFPKGAPQQRAKRAAEALVKAANYSRLMAGQQIHALEAELDFHRGIYSLQVQYTEALFQGIKQAYHNFQENVAEIVCSPLKDVLSSYAELTMEANETALRNFLTIFKNNVEQIQEAVDTLTPSEKQQHEGDEALSKLGKDFFLALESSLKNCGEERDKSALEIEKLKKELDESVETLSSLKKERKQKGSSKDFSTRSEVESTEGTGLSSTDQGKDTAPQHFGYRKKNSHPIVTSRNEQTSEKQPIQEKPNPGSVHHHRSKSLQRSKSVRNPSQPPWQD